MSCPRLRARLKVSPMTAHELFATISPQLAAQIMENIHATDKELYRVALHATAQARKVRPVFLERQPRQDRHRAMVAALARADLDSIAANVISGWLVKNQSELLTDFLDALKIEHQKGVVDTLPESISDEDLNSAIERLLTKYPAEIVGLYLHAFIDMNEANWPNLRRILDTDVRLMVGA